MCETNSGLLSSFSNKQKHRLVILLFKVFPAYHPANTTKSCFLRIGSQNRTSLTASRQKSQGTLSPTWHSISTKLSKASSQLIQLGHVTLRGKIRLADFNGLLICLLLSVALVGRDPWEEQTSFTMILPTYCLHSVFFTKLKGVSERLKFNTYFWLPWFLGSSHHFHCCIYIYIHTYGYVWVQS